MNEDFKNLYDMYEFPQDWEPAFANMHIISHSPREFFLTFGIARPPSPKIFPLMQVVMTRDHVMELMLNLQSQLKKFDEEHGQDRGKFIPPDRF